MQACRCRSSRCGRRFSHDSGFLHMACRGDAAARAIDDHCGGRTSNSTLDSPHKTSEKPARSALNTSFVKFPRAVGKYILALPCQLPPVVLVDEVSVKLGGVRHAIYSSQDEGHSCAPRSSSEEHGIP